jgi:aldose 1-epimerase
MTTTQKHGLFSAESSKDTALDTTVLSLSYVDEAHPERSMTVGVAPDLGSNLFHFRVGEYDLLHCEPALLQRKDFTGDFVLWPFPNRVRDKKYSYQGKEYSLEPVKRPSGNWVLIHGLVFDLPWSYEQPVVKSDSASVTTYIDFTKETPLFECYPFESRLSLTYTLTSKGLSITYHVENKGQHDLPFGFALHPYFSLLSGRQETYVTIPAQTVMEADNELLPTGRLLDVEGIMYAMYDLREPVPVGNLKLDHVYTNLQSGTAIIDYRKQGFQLHVTGSDDFTHVVIYTATAADNFFCLEHQTCSTDAINLHNQGPERQKIAHLLELHPGQSHSGTLHYTPYFPQ